MKKDNKKALYESIIASVAKEVKKVLNEHNFTKFARYCNEYVEDEPGDTSDFLNDACKMGCKVEFEDVHGYRQVTITGQREGVETLIEKWYGPDEIEAIESL